MIKVVITDDHPIVLDGLKNLLDGQSDITVAGCFSNGTDALQALQELTPDVLLLDINLPDINGLDLCRQIRKKDRDIRIIALSVHNERPVIKSMLQSGANGYVLKNALADEIIKAVHETMKGHIYLCNKTQEVFDSTPEDILNEIPRITRREKEILELVGKGFTTQQIAEQLFISTHTVESHRKNLMEKFGVNNMASVVKLVAEYNLL